MGLEHFELCVYHFEGAHAFLLIPSRFSNLDVRVVSYKLAHAFLLIPVLLSSILRTSKVNFKKLWRYEPIVSCTSSFSVSRLVLTLSVVDHGLVTVPILVLSSFTIFQLKILIQSLFPHYTKPENLRLVLKGKPLSNERSLSYYGKKEADLRIVVMPGLSGGSTDKVSKVGRPKGVSKETQPPRNMGTRNSPLPPPILNRGGQTDDDLYEPQVEKNNDDQDNNNNNGDKVSPPLRVSDEVVNNQAVMLENIMQMLLVQQQNQTVAMNKMLEMEKKISEMKKKKRVDKESDVSKTPYKPPRRTSNLPPSPLVIDDDPSSLSEDEVRRLLTSYGNRNVERGAKALVIKNVEVFDGKSPFGEWFKGINVKLIAGKHNDQVKLATLVEYLSSDILKWIAELDDEVLNSFNSLYSLLSEEFKDKSKSMSGSMKKIIETRQLKDEAVTTYCARLLAAVNECDVILDRDKVVKSIFVDGLTPKLMEKVRSKVHSLGFAETVAIAKAKEADILLTRAALKRNNNDNISSGSSVNNINDQNKKKSNYNNNINTNSNINTTSSSSSRKCGKCNVNMATPGKNLCDSCFRSRNNNNQNEKKNNNYNSKNPEKKEVDFTKSLVKFVTADNSSVEALQWDYEKLKKERKCFYCTLPLESHRVGEECRTKYPHYVPAEVRALLYHKKLIPARSERPTGTPSPP